MNITQTTLKHPKPFLAGLLIFLVLSVIAFLKTPLKMMPTLESPLLAIITQAEGTPAEIEEAVTIPIEQRLRDLSQARMIRSASTGVMSMVLVQYQWGTDMEKARMALEGKIAEIQNEIKVPHSVPVVTSADPLNLPVVVYGFIAPDLPKLREEVERLADSIRAGSGLRADESRGIRAALVVGGTPDPLPVPAILPIEPIIVPPETEEAMPEPAQPAPDIAMEQPMPFQMDMWSSYTFDGKEGVELAIYAEPNADSRVVQEKVAQKISDFDEKHPDYYVGKVYDNAHFISRLSENMQEELILSIVLAAIMLLIFLQSARAMLIVLLTIPISLAGAFLIFPFLGVSLNSSTLVGLLLAIGRLVDDSIIVIHAVHRHIQTGMPRAQAAVKGVGEVYLAILSSTVIMMIAVLPLAFAPGLTGIMFIGIAVPILATLAVSFFVSITLTPLLAAALFRPATRGHYLNPLTWFYRFCEACLSALEHGYRNVLRFSLRFRWLILPLVALIAVSGLFLFKKIGSEMMPLSDTAQISLMYDLDSRLSPRERIQQSIKIEELFLAQPEVEHISSELGMIDETYINLNGFNPMTESSISALVTLADKDERTASIWDVIDRVAPKLREDKSITRFTMKEMGSDVMATAGAPAEIVISGYNRKLLQVFSQEVFKKASELPGLYLPHTTGMNRSTLLWRENYKPSVIIGGFYRRQDVPSMELVSKMWGEAERTKQDLFTKASIDDYSSIAITGRGDMVEMMDATAILITNLLVAAGLIFLFLIIFFRSLSLPFIIFLAIPLELTGVLGALYLSGQTFSTVSILGIIILNGIDVATAILLIDFLKNDETRSREERNRHVIQAATIRLRPVLMTVLITILVLIPLAFSPKAGIDAFSPLAIVILGGLSLSSVLVLVVVPTLFTVFDDMRLRKFKSN